MSDDPPEVEVEYAGPADRMVADRHDLADEVADAVDRALNTVIEPAIVDGPTLWEAATYTETAPEHHVGYLAATFQGAPGITTALQEKEDFEQALRDELPEGCDFERRTRKLTTIYRSDH